MKNYIEQREENTDKHRISNEIAILKSKYYEKDPFEDLLINKDRLFERVARSVPSHFIEYVDTIIVGQFEFLDERELDALYSDGSIYISNQGKESELDIVDDIIHEIAHAVEENNLFEIYSDNLLEKEFVGKRRRLFFLLKENGFEKEVEFYDFEKVEYEEPFDIFLYQEVSYPLLQNLTSGLFCSPYGATSLREYFANCFEHYFLGKDQSMVKVISPEVYRKIRKLENND